MQGKVNMLMQNYLADVFPEVVYPLPDEISEFQKGISWMTYFRSLYYLDLIREKQELIREQQELIRKDVFLPDAGQAIINRKKYSLAVKAGHNDEQHNHNDIGNFILSTKNGQIFCDLGAGRYTRQYFGPERYEIFCNGSQGHNVPIIDGHFQKEGREYCGKISYVENRITVEMAGAYEAGVIDRLTRTFLCDENKIVLKDSFSEVHGNVIERFVTLREPQICENMVTVDNVHLKFDPSIVQVSVSQAAHENTDCSSSMVNCIDFSLKPGIKDAEFIFEIKD